ncbi:hypothetical protein E4T56_gene818 [Termitomyces sp. T112]|nr:hypothetical protein E4T56_gene818 [Termitomyces sp. T112]
MTPSSLPPSSPPSASSGLFVDLGAYDAQHLLSPSVPENLELKFDEPGLDIEAAGTSNPHAHPDPFGFFALENKLKIFRSRQKAEPRDQTVPVPPPQTIHSDLPTPSTPLARRKRKAIESPIPSDNSSSEPDTISRIPLKPIAKKGKERAVAEDRPIRSAELVDDSLETLGSRSKSGPPRRNAKVTSSAKESSNSSHRYSLLQTGATANSRKGVRRGRRRDAERFESAEEAVMKPTRQKLRVERPAKVTIDSNTDMKTWEQERQARL